MSQYTFHFSYYTKRVLLHTILGTDSNNDYNGDGILCI